MHAYAHAQLHECRDLGSLFFSSTMCVPEVNSGSTVLCKHLCQLSRLSNEPLVKHLILKKQVEGNTIRERKTVDYRKSKRCDTVCGKV